MAFFLQSICRGILRRNRHLYRDSPRSYLEMFDNVSGKHMLCNASDHSSILLPPEKDMQKRSELYKQAQDVLGML